MRKIIVLTVLVLLSSCASRMKYEGIKVKNFKVDFEENSYSAKFDEMSGDTYRPIELSDSDELSIAYNATVTKGDLEFAVLEDNGTVLWKSEKIASKINETKQLQLKENTNYKVLIRGNNASGNFVIEWNNK